MRRPFPELAESVSAGVLFRLGQAMSSCISRLSRILAEGAEQGVFSVSDPDYVANHLYAQGLGAMHLARVATGVRELAPGVPQLVPFRPEDVARAAVDTAFAYVLAPGAEVGPDLSVSPGLAQGPQSGWDLVLGGGRVGRLHLTGLDLLFPISQPGAVPAMAEAPVVEHARLPADSPGTGRAPG